jgi:two-component system response regulator DesR
MPLRILVVEDFAPFRRLVCTALRQRPEFEIVEAADGLEAVQKADELQPDLLLLDINLPKLDGFEVARRIRRLAPRARFLFVSQESSPDIVRMALGLGAHGFVQKLSTATDLLPAIEAAVAGQRFVSRSVASADPAAAVAPRRHELLFCRDDAAMIDGLTRFIAATLNADDAAIAVVTEPTRKRLLQQLRAKGVNIDGAIERGTYLSMDADADIAPDPVAFLEAIGAVRGAATRAGKPHPRVAVCGERAGRLYAAGRTADAMQLERVCRAFPPDVDSLCAYPGPPPSDDVELKALCAEHTAVFAS